MLLVHRILPSVYPGCLCDKMRTSTWLHTSWNSISNLSLIPWVISTNTQTHQSNILWELANVFAGKHKAIQVVPFLLGIHTNLVSLLVFIWHLACSGQNVSLFLRWESESLESFPWYHFMVGLKQNWRMFESFYINSVKNEDTKAGRLDSLSQLPMTSTSLQH